MPAVDFADVQRVFRTAPFVADLGLRLEAVERDGTLVCVLDALPRHLQSDGFHVLTAELKLSPLRAARGERLRCRARVIKSGRQLSFAKAEVRCLNGEESRLVCKASATMAVVGETRQRGALAPGTIVAMSEHPRQASDAAA